jgi:hypothetical protein
MGGDTELRSILRDEIAKEAFHIIEPYTLSSNNNCNVSIFDCLTRLRSCPSALMSGQQFFQLFITPVQNAIERNDYAVVLLIDYGKFQPKQKEEEHKERAKQQKATDSYRKGCTINDQGLLNEDGEQTGPFEVGRLMCSGHMRFQICQYFQSKLEKLPMKVTDPLIVFDWNGETGPWCNRSSSLVHQHLHHHGESDTSIPYWIRWFAQYNEISAINVYSTDTDMIPILLLTSQWLGLITRRDAPQVSIYWSYTEKVNESESDVVITTKEKRKRKTMVACEKVNRTVWVDIEQLEICIEQRLLIDQYVVFFILCGTDFVKRKRLAPGFGCKQLYDAFEKYLDNDDVIDGRIDLSLLLRILYTTQVKWLCQYGLLFNDDDGWYELEEIRDAFKARAIEENRKRKKKDNLKEYSPKQFIPSDEELEDTESMIAWNYKYWSAASRAKWLEGDKEMRPEWPFDPYLDSIKNQEVTLESVARRQFEIMEEEKKEYDFNAEIIEEVDPSLLGITSPITPTDVMLMVKNTSGQVMEIHEEVKVAMVDSSCQTDTEPNPNAVEIGTITQWVSWTDAFKCKECDSGYDSTSYEVHWQIRATKVFKYCSEMCHSCLKKLGDNDPDVNNMEYRKANPKVDEICKKYGLGLRL